MKLKDGFILNKVGGAYLAVAVGERADEFRALVKLNATGAFLWEQLAAGERGACELADALGLKGYKVAFDEKAIKTVSKNSFSERYGARNMRRYIQSHVEDKIADAVVSSEKKIALINISGNEELTDTVITCV